MPQQVFIKVVGFTDVERHALNTLFRLSEDRPTSYWLWTPESSGQPQLVLLDGQSYEARLEAESPGNADKRLVWIGDDPPPIEVWRGFGRPLAWPDVVEAIDELFTPQAEVAFDLDLDMDMNLDDQGPATLPPDEVPEEPQPARRALIAHADLNERLYLRAKLALNQLTVADEAETVAQALELMKGRSYVVALVDFGLPDGGGWPFIQLLQQAQIPHLIVTKERASLPERLRAWFAGVEAFYSKPIDPLKLEQVLQKT
jgi:CheY-like chemotaxis protein